MATVVPTKQQHLTKKELRVAFYGRVSTQEQNLEGYSPQFQKEQLYEHVKRKDYKGWTTKPEWHFFDVGSGSEYEERKGLQRLLKLVRRKEIDLVLVWKIDRLSRNLSDLLELFEEMDTYGVGFASVKEDLDFTGAIGKLIFQIFGALAEFERENIKMRTEEGKKASAMQGNYVGGSVPYGYEAIKNTDGKGKKLRLLKEEAKIVRQIFQWFTHEGKAMSWIATMLNDADIPKSKGNGRTKGTRWHDMTIQKMLSNEVYRGAYIVNRLRLISHKPELYEERPKEEWIYTKVEAAVDDVLFYMTQERLRQKHERGRGGGTEIYMLSGKLIDANTRRGFTGYSMGDGTKYYRRKQFIKDGKRHGSFSIRADMLENTVWGFIEKALHDPEEFLKLHEQGATERTNREALSVRLLELEHHISNLNGRIEKARNLLYEEDANERQIREDVARFEGERDGLFSEKQQLENEIARLGQYEVAADNLRYFSAKLKAQQGGQLSSYEEKQKMVDMFVERIEIETNETGRTVRTSYRFDPKAISEAIPVVKFNSGLTTAKGKPLRKQKPKEWWVGRDSNPRPMP